MTERPAIRQTEVLDRVLEIRALDLHTGLPGRVRSYDTASQSAEIEVLVRRVLPSGDDDEPDTTEDYPILPSVPVLWPRGGGYYLHAPLAEGDHVYVLFAEQDLNAYRASGAISDPGLATRHGLSGAVAVPGMFWRGDPLQDPASGALRIGREGGPHLDVTSSEIQAGGTDALAIAADVRAHLQAISAALATIAAAATTTSSYVYATAIEAHPIDTNTLKGS